ncbi:MAG TPA: DUF6569 family protein [Actinomycetota bacterium]|nr:DUF6569 family protein [Actinomycetota bacterium]
MNATEVVRERLNVGDGGLRFGDARRIGPLTLIPLFATGAAAEYVPYSIAQAEGLVSVKELGAAGSVPTLLVRNTGAAPVLLVEGEILIGLKQNRVLNVSVLVPAASEVPIPVACVEAGRWHFNSSAGLKDQFHLSPQVRGVINVSVAGSARRQGDFMADQGAVWDGVDERLAAHGVSSATAAYSDIGAYRREEIMEKAAAARPEPGQVGVLAMVAGEPLCLDLFDREETLATLWEGLVGSYVSDALAAPEEEAPLDMESVHAWIAGLAQAEVTEHPGAALGRTVVATAPTGTAAGLVVGQALVHLSAVSRETTL